LLHNSYAPGGKQTIELSERAKADLLLRLGSKTFRRTIHDDDGVTREYLIKRFAHGAEILEVRLTWYGQAWPLVQGGCAKAGLDAKELQTRLHQPLLFEELEEQRRRSLNSYLQFLQAVKHGRKVLEAVLCAFGRDGENPLLFPAWQLKDLLECEKDPDGFRKIRGCLMALQELRFQIHSSGCTSRPNMHLSGPFLSQVAYAGRGPGDHTDGDFYLSINPAFIGCLGVFQTGLYRVRRAASSLIYNWGKNLSKQEKSILKKDAGFIKSLSALAPYYDSVKGLSYSQSNLRRWVESQITLNKDGARKDRREIAVKSNAPNANEPRNYDRGFCNLLPRGNIYWAALGHYLATRHPEAGWTLLGKSRSAKGLLAVMGYSLPWHRKSARRRTAIVMRALQDLRAVIGGALGGIIVARRPTGEWLTLEEVAKLPTDEILRNVTWAFFLSPSFPNQRAKEFEKYHAERFARGEIDYPIKITTDRVIAEKSYWELAGESFGDGRGLAVEPMFIRLHTAICERQLSLAKVGKIFGVSRQAIYKWKCGEKPIPARLLPLINRWILTGESPAPEELQAPRNSQAPQQKPDTS
jgi:hypothetical protein